MGGSAQNTSSIISDIDFSPIIQFGENQDATYDKVNKQEAKVSPSQEGGGSLGVGVGVGGGSGTASMPTSKLDNSVDDTGFSDMPVLDKNALEKLGVKPEYLIYGGSIAVALYLFKKKKKK